MVDFVTGLMRRSSKRHLLGVAGAVALCLEVHAAEGVARSGFRDPAVRHAEGQRLRTAQAERQAVARVRGRQLGAPLREATPNGGARELMDVDGDQLLYYATCNTNAGISSGANLLWSAPYGVNGSLGTIGLWDASSARLTHQEYSGRVTCMDGSVTNLIDHSSHVAGTLAAAGVVAAAKGMAPGARIDSYDWNGDISEMSARGASYPGEVIDGTNALYISSHSYGFLSGWYNYGGTPKYIWYGSGTTASGIEDDFGKYSSYVSTLDSLAYGLPYYLPFWAAGNDRPDNPALGDTVYLSSSTTTITYYDPALHPPGDGTYRGGYDTISYYALAKNIVTVGAVKDAVTNGVRNVSFAVMTSFSSWGPADDGRIKPDLVANGNQVYSSFSSSDSAYGTLSGTSMATPSAAGTAQLLVHEFGVLFTNQYMRASTLKALLIHTADDLGTAGPDYQNGWGLINATNAASLLQGYRAHPGSRRVTEDHVATNRTSVSFAFTWDGVSPIRATLCWTDPAGASTTAGDSRTAKLVNNLDLRLIGPSGTVHLPWVMPFVGNWATNAYATAATTGSNYTDNVEQVLVASPESAGTYTARVTYAGTLTNGDQPFSLILSGASADDAAGAPALTASSPASGSGELLFALTGTNLLLGGKVTLSQAGVGEAEGRGVQTFGNQAQARIDTSGLSTGAWNLTYTNPDGQSAVVTNAFVVRQTLWSEDFETNDIAAKGWTYLSTQGSSQWGLSTANGYVSATRAMFSAGASSESDTSAVSPVIPIASRAYDLTLAFWQRRMFSDSGKDGGVLELSVDSGAWMNVTNAASGAVFSGNGYNATLTSKTNPFGEGCPAWSGSGSGFEQVQVALTNTARFAGHSLRVRWRFGTNRSTASTGWALDDAALTGALSPSKATVLSVR